MLKLPRMLPYAAPGRSALQPALERPLGRVASGRRLSRWRVHRHRDLERPGGGARGADGAPGRRALSPLRRRRCAAVSTTSSTPATCRRRTTPSRAVATRRAHARSPRPSGRATSATASPFVAPGWRSNRPLPPREGGGVLRPRGPRPLRQGDGVGEDELVELGPGERRVPAGAGIAHQFINDGDVPLAYLAISNKVLLRRRRVPRLRQGARPLHAPDRASQPAARVLRRRARRRSEPQSRRGQRR